MPRRTPDAAALVAETLARHRPADDLPPEPDEEGFEDPDDALAEETLDALDDPVDPAGEPPPFHRPTSRIDLGAFDHGEPQGGFGYGGPPQREVKVPFWSEFYRVKDRVQRLKVERRLADGTYGFVGHIGPDFAIEELAVKVNVPGYYQLTPLDALGRHVGGADRFTVDLQPDNDVFRAMQQQTALGGRPGYAAPPNLDVDKILDRIAAERRAADEAAAAIQAKIDAARDEIAKERAEVERQRTALLVKGSQDAVALVKDSAADERKAAAERIKDERETAEQRRREERDYWARRDKEDADRRAEAAKEAEAQRKAENDRSRAFFEALQKQADTAAAAQIKLQTDAMSLQMKLIEDRAKEREQAAKEREKEREQSMIEREKRSKEHFQLVLDHLEKQKADTDLMGQVQGLMVKATPLLKAFGLEPADLMGKLMGGGEQSWGQIGADLVKEVIRGRIELAKLEAAGGPEEEEADPEQLAQVLEMMKAKGLLPGTTADGTPTGTAPSNVVPGPGAPAAAPADESYGLSRKALRNARTTLAAIVTKCQVAPIDQWLTIVTEAVLDAEIRTDVLAYLRKRTLRAALIEAGADAGQAVAILNVIDNSGLVPADIPRG